MAFAGFEFNAKKMLIGALVLMALAYFIGYNQGYKAGQDANQKSPETDRKKAPIAKTELDRSRKPFEATAS